ncbi:MAG: LysM domain-containing protein [Planctomycetia bacterium]|nr:LysM domain-containing protein [Planctomycetia bacterium]
MVIGFKSRSRPKSREVLLWFVVGMLVIWGAWQAISVRRQVLRALDTRTASVPATQAASTPLVTSSADESSDDQPPAPIPFSGAFVDAPPEVLRVLAPGQLRQTGKQIMAARAMLKRGHLLIARHMLQAARRTIAGFGEQESDTIRSLLSQINRRTILGSAIVPGDPLVKVITVRAGDSIDYLATLYRITPAMIEHINPGLQPATLIPGQGVKVILGPMNAHIILHALRVDVTIRGRFITAYPFRLTTPIEPSPGQYKIVDFLPGPLGLDEWILQSENSQSRVIVASGDISGTDIKMSSSAISALARMMNQAFSRIAIEP